MASTGNGDWGQMNRAVSAQLCVMAAFVGCGSAYASDVVVVGKFIANEPMQDLKDECSDGDLCMHHWWKAVIQVEKTLKGRPISGRITAAVSQHIGMNEKYKKSVRYFTLETIEDPATRAHLHADYYLEEAAIDPPDER